MSIIKWFKGLFSNKYSVVYDPARDDSSGVSISKVEVTKNDAVNDILIDAVNEVVNKDIYISYYYDGPHPKRKEREESRRSSGGDDVAMHLLLNPLSPMNVWHSGSDDYNNSHSSSNHDSSSYDSSSYDSSGFDSGGGDCGGGGD